MHDEFYRELLFHRAIQLWAHKYERLLYGALRHPSNLRMFCSRAKNRKCMLAKSSLTASFRCSRITPCFALALGVWRALGQQRHDRHHADRQAGGGLSRHTRTRGSRRAVGGRCYCLPLFEPKPREKKGRQWEEVESIFPHFFLPSVSAKTEGEKRGK